ncbi:MAG: sugar phosphate nucleotidyltransferase [Candidatus Bathyarchaeota archaeon]|nr:sugar phosphate nucleotidyltransferase [Candidatus Bathyarchaeota archaeon]MDH5732348.1 sugar phosphate nucleotidyltransferase [Candidatus Bathyarchaeota archaeon]
MKAVVLSAGEGIRLRPLTFTRPKHLIPVGGKPLLEHLLTSVKTAGLDEVLVVIHYMGEKIQSFFGDGSKFGLQLKYVVQKEMGGTADAIGAVEPFVDDDFLLIYGDLLVTPNTIKQVLRSNEKEKATTTMAVVPVKHPENYGIVKLDDSYVTEIFEKPSDRAPTNLANAGIYVFSTEIFQKIKQTTPSSRGELEITDSLRLLLDERQRVLAVPVSSEEWLDVGRPWDLFDANERVLRQTEPVLNGEIEDGAHLMGQISVARGARIRSGTYIRGPTFIGENSDIGPNCYIRPYTSIGRHVRIGNACEIKNSIILDRTQIGHLSYVGDSLVGEECNLGAGSVVANYRLDGRSVKVMVKGEVVDSGRTKLGVILGDHVKTGINSLFMPGVKVGHGSWIGPNVVVYRDVPSNTGVLLKQEIEQKEI